MSDDMYYYNLWNEALAERDRARDVAVALEQQLARVEALADRWENDHARDHLANCADSLREALTPEGEA